VIQVHLIHDFCIALSNIKKKNKLCNNLSVSPSPLPVKNSECAADNELRQINYCVLYVGSKAQGNTSQQTANLAFISSFPFENH